MDTLAQLQALDQGTLTPLVRQALGNDAVSLVDWRVAPFGGGAGQCVYRFSGNARNQGELIPWSLVLKVAPTPSDGDAVSAAHYRSRELLAYQSGLLAELPGALKAPRCFGVVEQSGGDAWLWLEEITDTAVGRWPRERYTTVARQLGTFNAAFLIDRPLPAYPWLSQGWFRSHVVEAAAAVAQLPALLGHPLLRPALPGNISTRVLQVIAEHERLLDALDALPQTFCHLDAFPRNLFVRNEGSVNVQLVAIDWEFTGVSALGADLAPLVGGSLLFDEVDLSTADELERDVFDSYLRGLRDAGWKGEQHLVRVGYTAALVLHYVFLILSVVVDGATNEDVRQFVETMQKRPYIVELERIAVFFRFLLARADEARQLLRS
jgi:hypothetical protein